MLLSLSIGLALGSAGKQPGRYRYLRSYFLLCVSRYIGESPTCLPFHQLARTRTWIVVQKPTASLQSLTIGLTSGTRVSVTVVLHLERPHRRLVDLFTAIPTTHGVEIGTLPTPQDTPLLQSVTLTPSALHQPYSGTISVPIVQKHSVEQCYLEIATLCLSMSVLLFALLH